MISLISALRSSSFIYVSMHTNGRTSTCEYVASTTFDGIMAYRTAERTLTDLRNLLARLEQNRHSYNLVSFAQLRRILRRRMDTLKAQLRTRREHPGSRRAA